VSKAAFGAPVAIAGASSVEHWRYIRYEDFYDHRVAPDEWTNLANKPQHEATKRMLARLIPANQHPGLKVQSWFDKFRK
jgi:hypothetical protein